MIKLLHDNIQYAIYFYSTRVPVIFYIVMFYLNREYLVTFKKKCSLSLPHYIKRTG